MNLITTTILLKKDIIKDFEQNERVYLTPGKNDLPRVRLILAHQLRSIVRAVYARAHVVIMARSRYGHILAVRFRGLRGQIPLELIAPLLKQGTSFAVLISYGAVRGGYVLGMILVLWHVVLR